MYFFFSPKLFCPNSSIKISLWGHYWPSDLLVSPASVIFRSIWLFSSSWTLLQFTLFTWLFTVKVSRTFGFLPTWLGLTSLSPLLILPVAHCWSATELSSDFLLIFFFTLLWKLIKSYELHFICIMTPNFSKKYFIEMWLIYSIVLFSTV